MADDVPETEEIPEDRELGLEGFASEWDLQLFREAQVSLDWIYKVTVFNSFFLQIGEGLK